MAGCNADLKKLIEEKESLTGNWESIIKILLVAFPSLSWLDIDDLHAEKIIEGLAYAEEVLKLRPHPADDARRPVEYKINEDTLHELVELQEELSHFVPDVMADDFIPAMYRDPIDDPEIEIILDPENTASEAEADAMMQSAIQNLYREDGSPLPTPVVGPTEALAERAIQPSPDAISSLNKQFGSQQHTGAALDGLSSMAGEAVKSARETGFGNLDVKQPKDFFDDESKWQDQV